ncbi:hypothetical protein ASU35_11895 [Acetivibrio ethanolgignens]|uniref:Uncharacterized protein n=2 Tax=Acetivibrio ethanolgignens TaxID=290052 RepID=A0A0V8QDZ1_9FIRM|nr:hypothetical protein ASU35_11895 [Acetivibrio ethanolgignens]
MYKYLENSLASYGVCIEDCTPVIEMNRPLEIVAWLKEKGNHQPFVSLDDDFRYEDYEVYGIGDQLVKTRFIVTVLRKVDCNKNMLKEQLRY